jgi:CHAD domain-containing protein
MFEFVTPHALFRTQIHTLRDTLPGVLDGSERSIHDARIATRRIRELLPLLGDPKRRKPIEDLYSRFKRLGRSLGRVRDADVRVTLLATLETRMPHAAPALVVLRQQREQERLQLLRKLVKRLERLEAVRMIEALDEHRLALAGPMSWGPSAGHTWKRDLRYTLRERAAETAAAIEHATGVYFPRRVHGARIAIKKMRYAMEIAHETGGADRSAAIRELKKAQDLLGDLHDRQELVDNLIETRPADQPEIGSQVSLLKQVIDAENHDLHTRYLARRSAILQICRFERQQLQKMPSRSLVAAGALAISSGIYANLGKAR